MDRHYFAIATNPGEQFYMFVILAAWLIRKGKKPFDTPQESDDPNATISNILDFVRRLVSYNLLQRVLFTANLNLFVM